ncbi:type VII secretion protein EccB [uncultured Mycobacterium sp.]|uniref:type VII secretion protein EccB n=1 Tax=uncultured Mycobacterium sp. TaxID=171292 RepID=UPI0035C9D235
MAWQPTTRLHVSGYRFLLRRLECALLRRNLDTVDEPMRAHTASFALGCLLAIVVIAGCAVLAFMRPQPALEGAPIVMGQHSAALYVRMGDTWHPVLNLVSAQLIAASNIDPRPVREADLSRTKRGPLLGIPGAPQLLGEPLGAGESEWAICDSGGETSPTTSVVVGSTAGPQSRRLAADQTILVTPESRTPTYLLYNGRRAVVDTADPAIVRGLRLEGVVPRIVSRSLLNAVPEVPPISAPRIPHPGGPGPATLPGFAVGSVLRVTRADSDEYYVVLPGGVQRIGHLAAELVRLHDSQGARTIVSVAPDVIGAVPVVNALPVSTFPDRTPVPVGAQDAALCLAWAPTDSGHVDVFFLTDGLPVPTGQAPVVLSQADGEGPAVDAVYLPPGRSAYVRSTGLSGDTTPAGTRYLVTDTGVRFAVHDDEAAHALGLAAAVAAPWPVLAALPEGPELSRQSASVARDVVVPARGGRGSQPP